MKMTAIALLFLLLPSLGAAEQSNVLLVTVDTLRYDRVGAHGSPHVKTPHLDRLAASGLVFAHAFAHTPLTLPSHANILTGTTPLYHGISDNNRFHLPDRFLTLAEHLKAAGYQTGAFVGSFVLSAYFGLNQGFDHYTEPIQKDEFLAEEVVDRALAWLAGKSAPWFCWVHVWDPHTPYSPPSPYAEQYPDDPYSGEVAYTDHQLGRIFAFLDREGISDRTLIVLTGDHGEALGDHGEREHGFFAYNPTIHIPLIVRLPGGQTGKIEQYVSHVDIFPTVCDHLGLPLPRHLQGRSLLPLIAGEPMKENPIYIEAKAAYLSKGWAPLEGFIRDRKKFIYLPIKEMYDLERDFSEAHNVISRFPMIGLLRDLETLKTRLRGEESGSSRMELSSQARQKLRTLGYMSGLKQEAKTQFTREDDLKVLLPLQNKLREARDLEDRGRHEEALSRYREVLETRPDTVSCYLHMAEIFQKTGRLQKGLEALDRGLEQKPGNLELLARRGVLLAETRRFDEAVATLKGVLEKEDFNPENWSHLGAAYTKQGRMEEARRAFEKALELDPTFGLAQANLGSLDLTLFLRSKDRDLLGEAIRRFTKALELDPKLVSAHNGLGAAYRFAGDRTRAVTHWRRALALDPGFMDAYFNLGITLIEMGRKAKALEVLETCRDRFADRLRERDRRQLQRLIDEAR